MATEPLLGESYSKKIGKDSVNDFELSQGLKSRTSTLHCLTIRGLRELQQIYIMKMNSVIAPSLPRIGDFRLMV